MRTHFLISMSVFASIASAQFSNSLAGGPSTVNVGQTQTFTATLPTVDSGYYLQFYLRVASSNPYQGDHTCNTVANPASNLFFMEADGNYGSNPVPWIPGAGKVGGSNDSWSNSQCTLQVLKSRAFINPDRSATITITVAFTNPTPLVPHSSSACPTNCDYYAPGGSYTTAERYWWVAGFTSSSNWHGYTPMAPVLPTAANPEWLWASPNFASTGSTQTFTVKVPKRYYPTPFVSWDNVEFRITQPFTPPHANQGAIPSFARKDTACTVIAYLGSNALNLENDAGTGYVGSNVSAGSGNTPQNSQCILNASASNMSMSSGDVTVNVSLTFKTPFGTGVDERWMWVRGTNNTYGVTNWIAVGWVKPTGTSGGGGGGDTTPPSLSRVASDPSTINSMVSWRTSEASNTQVFWGLTTSYGNQTAPSQPGAFDHSAMLQGLAPGTKYYFQARSTDAAGNLGIASGQFRTDDTWPRTLCPTPPNPLPAQNTPNWILLCTSLLSADVSGTRWEPTSAAGINPSSGQETYVHAWYEFAPVANSYFVYWTGSSWSTPMALTTADGQQLLDVNLTWDPAKSRFAYVAGTTDGSTWYGYSLNSTGSSWYPPKKVFDPSIPPTNPPPGFNYWDYPAIAINNQGKVVVAAVGAVYALTPAAKTAGYYAAVIDADGPSGPVTPTTIVQDVGVRGQGARLVAAGTQFHAFLTAVTPAEVPTRLDRWGGQVVQVAGGDSLQWDSSPTCIKTFEDAIPFVSADLPSGGIGAESLLAMLPTNISAAGSPDGNWAVAFQTRNGSYNLVWICSSDRLCGYTNDAAEFQFMPSVSVSYGPADANYGPARPNYWLSYLALQPDESVRLNSWLLRPGSGPVGVIEPAWISVYGWSTNGQRCGPLPCRAAGDFITSAALYTSGPRAKASIPVIATRIYPTGPGVPDGTAARQLFLQGPLDTRSSSSILGAPISSWATFPLGSSHRSSGTPHRQQGSNFALRRLIYTSRRTQ